MKDPRFVHLVILVMGYRKFCLDEPRGAQVSNFVCSSLPLRTQENVTAPSSRFGCGIAAQLASFVTGNNIW